MKKIKGFTLLELLIVVLIIGILASLAIPRYIKATESAKAAEAYKNLNAIRQAEWAYYARTGMFVADMSSLTNFDRLDIESPNTIPNRDFDYRAYKSSIEFDWIKAVRKSGPYVDDFILMYPNGNIDESNWLK